MPQWNRFDICEAWYVFAVEWHGGQWSPEYAIFGRLNRMNFTPGAHIREGNKRGMTENARDILAGLIRKMRRRDRAQKTL